MTHLFDARLCHTDPDSKTRKHSSTENKTLLRHMDLTEWCMTKQK